MWFLLFVLTATVLLGVKLWRTHTYWERKGIPFDKPVPFFGMMLDILLKRRSPTQTVDIIYREHSNKRYVGIYQFTTPAILLRDPELIKTVCVRDFDSFPEHRTIIPEGVEPLWTKNLLTANADRWRSLRSIMSPTFTGSKMKIMFNAMDECARKFVDYFSTKTSDILDVELKDIFTRFTNDVIASTTFGIEVDSLRDKDNEFYRMGKIFATLDGAVTLKFILYSVFTLPMKLLNISVFPREASAFFNRFFKEATKHREDNNVSRPDLLHLLLQARKSESKGLEISDEELAAQAMIFFLGGFETVSSSLCFTIYELAIHQEIQDRLREEVDEVWKNLDGKPTFEEISKMKYLDMVISESLRKNPPMMTVDRQTVKPYIIEPVNENEKPLLLETGSSCFYSIYSLHWDEDYFPNPKKFDPERFSDENKRNIKSGTYVPFGVGPRNCLGSRFAVLEMKTLVFHLIRNFHFIPNKKTEIPLELQKDSITLAAKNGFHLAFKKRQF